MGYTVTYAGSREEQDADAIRDTEEYLGDRWPLLLSAVRDTTRSVEGLGMLMGFAGVTGRPFHALMRRERLADYIAWMRSGADAVDVDAAGFPRD
jgi:hypothetical protein